MPDLTPRDDVKKAVSEILKRVDQLLKAGELDQAISQVAKAKELDSKNVYVFAYEERITAMKEERRMAEEIDAKRKAEEEERQKEEDAKKKVEEEKRKAEYEKRHAEEERRRKIDEEQRRKEEEKRREEEEEQSRKEEEQRRVLEERRHAEEERRRTEDSRKREDELRKKIDSERKKWGEGSQGEEPGQKRVSGKLPEGKEEQPKEPPEEEAKTNVPEISQEVLDETKRKILEDRKKKGIGPKVVEAPPSYRRAYDEGVDIYRRALIEAWADGATTPAEKEQLESLRSSLQITAEDHTKMEKEAKIGAYTQAFRRAWSTGAISPDSATALAELRKKFKISLEEHEQIEAKLLWELRSSSQKAQILIIDDDEKLLKVVSDTLQDAGYQTVAVTTTDEAFKFLKDTTPDLILSDINLETSTMGGFTFYEKVREMERLHEIPFIFLSGLTDEVLIRTGKELGVDDYLTKPFSEETLLATIKGKLKRYRQLRKSHQKK